MSGTRKLGRRRAAHRGPAARTPEIIEIAARAFATHGYRGASLREIARDAGVSKAVLYDCFPDGKAELYAAVLERAQRRFEEAVVAEVEEPHGSVWSAVAAGVHGLMTFLDEEPYAVPYLIGANGVSEESVEQLARARDETFASLAGSILRVLGADQSGSAYGRSGSSQRAYVS